MSARIAIGHGTWAELIALPPHLHPPAIVSPIDAATLSLAGLTARQALDKLALQPRQRLLVTGAAGGVGGLAAESARQAGVDALVSRPEHMTAQRELGADGVACDRDDLDAAAWLMPATHGPASTGQIGVSVSGLLRIL